VRVEHVNAGMHKVNKSINEIKEMECEFSEIAIMRSKMNEHKTKDEMDWDY